jgi:hypothetical protein
MALDSPLLVRQRVFAAKAEVTTGTAQTLAGTDGALFNYCASPKFEADIPATKRQGQGTLSRVKAVPGAYKGKASFKTELFGSGTAATAPGWATLLLPAASCLFTSNVATPVTGPASFPTVTLGLFRAGRLYRIAGTALDLTMKGKSGSPIEIDWKAEGVWQAPISQALITPTYPTVVPPRFAGATFTVGGTSYTIENFEFALGNSLYVRPDITQTAGYKGAVVTDRNPVLKIDPESLPLGTQDWYAAHLAMTTFAFTMTVGTVAGNQMTLASPVLQLVAPPKDKESGDVLRDDLEFIPIRNTNAGDDEWSLTFV